MTPTRVTVESGEIRMLPSLCDMLLAPRLGGRLHGGGWVWPATPANARMLRSNLRSVVATPEFDALLGPVAAVEEHFAATPAADVVSNAIALLAKPEPEPPAMAAVSQPVALPVPAGMRTSPWRHQQAAFDFCMAKFGAGFPGILLAMMMGCVEGDAEVTLNRRGRGFRIPLREFHRKFHGGESNGRRWRRFPTLTGSMAGGEIRLNEVLDVMAKGTRPVVRITLASGKTLRVTSDHEIATAAGCWKEAAKLVPGDVVLTNGTPVCRSCGGTRRVATCRYAKHAGVCRSCIAKLRGVTTEKCIDKDGYVRIYRMHSHPRANKAGQVYEHIVVMERVVGRPITSSEHIHHKNHVRHDNRPQNLEVLPAVEHYRHHGTHGGYLNIDGVHVHFIPKPDKVMSVEPDGETDVYDIRMAGPGHNFVANGIVVHNCGKSLVFCMLVLALKARRILIACPLRVVPVWVTQFERHVDEPVVVAALDDEVGSVADKLKFAQEKMRLAEALGRPFVCIINFDSGWRTPFAEWAAKMDWDLVGADEAHKIKSATGRASKYFGTQLAPRAKRRVAMTGTPMPHNHTDIFGILRFVDVSILGRYWGPFRREYCEMGGYKSKQIVGARNLPQLEAKVARVMFRVGSEVLDLPPETQVTYKCELSPEGRRVYRSLDEYFVAGIKDGTITAANAMVKVLRLAQLTGGWLKTDEGQLCHVDDSKQKLLEDTLEDIGELEPAVVFCWFHEDLGAVHDACRRLNYTCMELSGRKSQLDDWQSGKAQVLAVQIRSGGVGVDLTRARYCMFYSLGYSLADYEQAKKRVHRPGQTRPVEHIHLLVKGTVDERIMRALDKRAEVIGAILAEIAAI